MDSITEENESSYGSFQSTEYTVATYETSKGNSVKDACLSWTKEKRTLLSSATHGISWPAYILLCIFFMSYWMATDSFISELPVIIQSAPERHDLPAYFAVIGIFSIIGPSCYVFCRKITRWRPRAWVMPLMILMTLGVIQILVASTWNVTTTVSGSEKSILLLVWAMLGYITDATATVQYPVFMEAFQSQYVSSLYIGDAMYGLVAACLGMVQGVGGITKCVNVTTPRYITGRSSYTFIPVTSPPLFSVTTYYMLTFAITCMCTTAFICVNLSPRFSHAKVSTNTLDYESFDTDSEKKALTLKENPEKCSGEMANTLKEKLEKYSLFAIIIIICSVFRIYHFGILQYASQPYKNPTYSYATRVSFIARSLLTTCALLFRMRSVFFMVLVTSLGLVMEAYIIAVAVMSPNPPLQGTDAGSNIVVSDASQKTPSKHKTFV